MNKIEYDKHAEVMSVVLANIISIDSDIRGNVVIDYDKQGDIVKVNFYNFNFELFNKYKKQINLFTRNHNKQIAVL